MIPFSSSSKMGKRIRWGWGVRAGGGNSGAGARAIFNRDAGSLGVLSLWRYTELLKSRVHTFLCVCSM